MADHTRALSLANHITGLPISQLEARLEDATISIGLDPAVPGVVLTVDALIGTLRRLPGHLAIDSDGLDREMVDRFVDRAAAIDPDRRLIVRRPTVGDIRVMLAPVAPAGFLRALPDHHGYHLATSGAPLRQTREASGLGSISTAAAVAAETFKYAAGVIGPRGHPIKRLSFCPVTLTHDPSSGPDLPSIWILEAMLLGLGAVGTGSAYILSEMPVEGEVDLIDPQRFVAENLGTYSLGGARDARDEPHKTRLVARSLPRFTTHEWENYATDLPDLVDHGQVPWPRTVLSGLDSSQARRDAGRLWPDRLIDGATGDTMTGLHVVTGAGRPCLACFLPDFGAPLVPVASDLAHATGLPRELLVQGDRVLTEADVDAVADDRRSKLRQFVGKKICALAEGYGLTDLPDEGYRPAIPFVALQAAALVVGRLVAITTGVEPAANFVQYDALVGPGPRTAERRRGRPGCDCETHAAVIEQVRRARAAQPGTH